MRKIAAILMLLLSLSGCGRESEQLDRIVSLRNEINNASAYSFNANITLDYGDSSFNFSTKCKVDSNKNMELIITEPQSISGISAQISGESGKLVYDDVILAIELIADGEITPISSPWLFTHALSGGYISTCSSDSNGCIVSFDDSYNAVQFTVNVKFDEHGLPTFAEIIWDGKRIVSMTVSDFVLL